MSQIITNAFAHYWQACLIDQRPVVLDAFVLANVPDLDAAAPIDPDSGLPPENQIVHRHGVDQRGRINNDAVAYTIVMDTTVGDFDFNAMYLINKASGMVGMIVHKGLESKLKTDEATGQTGNSLVKSMLMEYERASEATATHVDASTWQIDYAARLRGMDDDLRLQALQFFGPATFYGDGFKLTNESGVYKVQPGVAYVGGLRAELNEVKKITPGAKPVGLWLDIYRAGSLLDAWVNHFTLTLSVPEMTDYQDSNGYQHHVAKVAIINADGSVTDVRRKRTIELTGDVSGKGILEDAQGVTIAVEIKDGSHRHQWGELNQVPATASRWPSWAEVTSKPTTMPPATHSHPWSQVSDAPATATRWPSWAEVTSKPTTMPPAAHSHPWSQLSYVPATATRWPDWSEVSGKPATVPPSAHNHTAAQGNQDIIADGWGQVGTYILAGRFDWGGRLETGQLIGGASLSPSNTEGGAGGVGPRLSGTWKCLGIAKGERDYGAWNVTLFIRVA